MQSGVALRGPDIIIKVPVPAPIGTSGYLGLCSPQAESPLSAATQLWCAPPISNRIFLAALLISIWDTIVCLKIKSGHLTTATGNYPLFEAGLSWHPPLKIRMQAKDSEHGVSNS